MLQTVLMPDVEPKVPAWIICEVWIEGDKAAQFMLRSVTQAKLTE